MLAKQVEIDFIEEKLSEKLGNLIQIMQSDTNAEK
jgi:DNA-directed RNA polymerase II subunit RPB1